MRPHPLLLSLFLCIFCSTRAQYADLGSGTLKNQIWWLDWSGFTIAEGASRTIQTNNGLTIKVTFSNVTSNFLQPSVMNTWPGAMLHMLYDFSDAGIHPALYDAVAGNISAGSHFKLTVGVSRNNSPINFTLVTADAEGSSLGETTTLQTNGSAWSTIELIRNSGQTIDPVTGCGTQTAAIHDTHEDPNNPSAIGQNPIIATRNTGTGPLTLDITLDHASTTGGMGVAFGILESVDRGDLPTTYGTAEHGLQYSSTNPCNYLPPLPQTTQVTNLKIGMVPPDADPVQTADDNAVGVDEDGISSFPVYNNNGSYTLTVPVGNTTGVDAYLTGWFDFNRNGRFDPGESVTATVPNNAASATLTWTGLPQWLPTGTAAGYGFRLRLSSDQLQTQSATGYAQDGEVEDYLVPSAVLCSIAVTAKPDTSVCPASPIPLSASGINVTQYNWSGGADISNPSLPNPSAAPLAPTSYTVIASNPQGCQASATIHADILPVPDIAKSNDTTICEGRTVPLSASGGVHNIWTSSDGLLQTTGTTITVAPARSTTYYVQVTNNNGCSKEDSIAVRIHFLSSFDLTPSAPAVCKNDSILLVASGGDLYAWSLDIRAIPGDAPALLVWPDANQKYYVKITDTICQVTKTLNTTVTVRPLPLTSVTKSNDIDCTLGQATLHASGGRRYLWDVDPNISDLRSPDPVVQPLTPTLYRVTVTGANGCSSRDSITVGTDYTAELSKYPVPSAFTPNNDGHNDCFGLKYWGRITVLQMEVFDRWGQRVFFTNKIDGCWDGNYKGIPQPAGAYVYQVRAVTPCGTAYRKGTIFLIR
ncbi:MAG: gliding motility-associated C-terminal domain-containing protein [Chitinophagaceae bacterium]|nr:gliding motility-associated C-terminal domain-containing protein [Chitinophagaceae bacterium]